MSIVYNISIIIRSLIMSIEPGLPGIPGLLDQSKQRDKTGNFGTLPCDPLECANVDAKHGKLIVKCLLVAGIIAGCAPSTPCSEGQICEVQPIKVEFVKKEEIGGPLAFVTVTPAVTSELVDSPPVDQSAGGEGGEPPANQSATDGMDVPQAEQVVEGEQIAVEGQLVEVPQVIDNPNGSQTCPSGEVIPAGVNGLCLDNGGVVIFVPGDVDSEPKVEPANAVRIDVKIGEDGYVEGERIHVGNYHPSEFRKRAGIPPLQSKTGVIISVLETLPFAETGTDGQTILNSEGVPIVYAPETFINLYGGNGSFDTIKGKWLYRIALEERVPNLNGGDAQTFVAIMNILSTGQITEFNGMYRPGMEQGGPLSGFGGNKATDFDTSSIKDQLIYQFMQGNLEDIVKAFGKNDIRYYVETNLGNRLGEFSFPCN